MRYAIVICSILQNAATFTCCWQLKSIIAEDTNSDLFHIINKWTDDDLATVGPGCLLSYHQHNLLEIIDATPLNVQYHLHVAMDQPIANFTPASSSKENIRLLSVNMLCIYIYSFRWSMSINGKKKRIRSSFPGFFCLQLDISDDFLRTFRIYMNKTTKQIRLVVVNVPRGILIIRQH